MDLSRKSPGLCGMHYTAARRSGIVDKLRPKPLCQPFAEPRVVTGARLLRTPQVLLVARNLGRAPDQGGGMRPSIGQGHAQQSVVHVLGGAVSRLMRAVNFPPWSNRDESGAVAGVHLDAFAV